jgi:hypothetical protein
VTTTFERTLSCPEAGATVRSMRTQARYVALGLGVSPSW